MGWFSTHFALKTLLQRNCALEYVRQRDIDETCFEELIPDDADRDYLIVLLRELKVDINAPKASVIYPKELSELLAKYKIK